MLLSLEEAKEYVRTDEESDDAILRIIIEATEKFMRKAGGKFDELDPLAKAVALLIVGDLYENRTFTPDKVAPKISPVASMLLTQLCCGGDAP